MEEILAMPEINLTQKTDMNIVIVGHVDHGKSTLMGRLLADTNSLPQGKLEQIKEHCHRNAKPFEYAFLLDALKDEQSQGITIDIARCFFKTAKRDYIILDAPGHIEFLKNMITGAARAQAALLVIDAKEGVQENSRRHGYMLSMLGIKQTAVVINKMDLVNYDEQVFESIKKEYLEFLSQINLEPSYVIPVSAFSGENIISASNKMPWYQGKSILEILDSFECEGENTSSIFRMPVQDVYKFTEDGDDRRIIAGTIDSGSIQVGQEIRFYPSGKKSYINRIEAFHSPEKTEVSAGMAVGFTLKQQIYIGRGELMTAVGETEPEVTSRMKVHIFWLGKRPLSKNNTYFIKIGTTKTKVILEDILTIINSSNLNQISKETIENYEVAECILHTEKPIAFDTVETCANTSRFVIVDQYEIAGGGIITEALKDEQSSLRHQVLLRNYKWEHSDISKEKRAQHYGQKARLLLFTGEPGVGKKTLAKKLELELLSCGRIVYYLGIGTFLYGVDSDYISNSSTKKEQHIRRFAEVIKLMLDAGIIVIATARTLSQKDIAIMQTVIEDDFDVIWIGEKCTPNIFSDIKIDDARNENNICLFKQYLLDQGIIFN